MAVERGVLNAGCAWFVLNLLETLFSCTGSLTIAGAKRCVPFVEKLFARD